MGSSPAETKAFVIVASVVVTILLLAPIVLPFTPRETLAFLTQGVYIELAFSALTTAGGIATIAARASQLYGHPNCMGIACPFAWRHNWAGCCCRWGSALPLLCFSSEPTQV
jgi:hypothetical protein